MSIQVGQLAAMSILCVEFASLFWTCVPLQAIDDRRGPPCTAAADLLFQLVWLTCDYRYHVTLLLLSQLV